MATLLVTQPGDGSGRFALSELPEWVGEGTCTNPTLPEPTCTFEGYPHTTLSGVYWTGMRSCSARQQAAGTTPGAVEMGGACGAPGFRWPAAGGLLPDGKAALPCGLRLPLGFGGSIAWSLDCTPPAEEPTHPAEGQGQQLAYRCVVPENLLDSIQPEAR
jgi:hypothetical protein